MAARRFSYAVLRGAYGGGFLAVWFGVGNARMRLGGGVFALLLHALLFFRSFPHFLLAFIPTSYFSVVALCARLCANLAFSLFSLLISLSISSLSFLSSRYLCALFLADGFLPLTS